MVLIKGIKKIQFLSKPFYKIYLHQDGLFGSDMAGASTVRYYHSFSMTGAEYLWGANLGTPAHSAAQ